MHRLLAANDGISSRLVRVGFVVEKLEVGPFSSEYLGFSQSAQAHQCWMGINLSPALYNIST